MTPFHDFAARQAEGFRIFTASVAGLRAAASAAGLSIPNPSTKRAINELGRSYVASVRYEAARFMADHHAEGAEVLAGRADARFEASMHAVTSLVGQIVAKSNRELTPEMGLSKLLQGHAGAIGLLIQNRAAHPTFQVKDTSGRTWEAGKLYSVVIRDFAYQTYIDHQFAEAMSAGEATVESSDGATYDLTGDWVCQRDMDFHINSTKVL